MKSSVPVSKARESLGGIVNRVALRGERIQLSRNGKPVAVVVPLEDVELLERLEDARDIADADRRLADPAEKPIPYNVARRELGLD